MHVYFGNFLGNNNLCNMTDALFVTIGHILKLFATNSWSIYKQVIGHL